MLFQRVVTAIVLAPLMLAGIYLLPPVWFSAFIGLIVVLGAWEWANLAGYQRMTSRLGLAAVTAAVLVGISWAQNITPVTWQALTLWSLLWWVVALGLVISYPASQKVIQQRWVRLVIVIPVLLPFWLGLNVLKQRPDADLILTWLMLLVWGADIGAYFAGRAFGRRKLAPAVSPGKTWAGVYGGMTTSIIISAVLGVWFFGALETAQWVLMLLFSAAVVAISVLGDLLESLLKRFRGVKDSSQLLPGHGGILDRIDSLCAATPMFCLLLALVAV